MAAMAGTMRVGNTSALPRGFNYHNRVFIHPEDFARLKAAAPSQGVGEDVVLLLLSGAGGDWVYMAAVILPRMWSCSQS